jgi:hypothetical protein
MFDRQRIRETLLRHSACSDEGNVEAMYALWAADCQSDAGGKLVLGRDAVLGRLAGSLARFSWTHHQLGESTIDVRGDEATAMTPALCWHKWVDGDREWVALRYHDELRRDGERWLITSRRKIVTGAHGTMADYGWTWLQRALPSADQ